MREGLRDRELTEDFEARSRAGKVEFASADELVGLLEQKKPKHGPRLERPAKNAGATKAARGRAKKK